MWTGGNFAHAPSSSIHVRFGVLLDVPKSNITSVAALLQALRGAISDACCRLRRLLPVLGAYLALRDTQKPLNKNNRGDYEDVQDPQTSKARSLLGGCCFQPYKGLTTLLLALGNFALGFGDGATIVASL